MNQSFPRPNVETAILTSQVFNAVGVGLLSCILVAEMVALWQRRSRFSWRHPQTRSQAPLIGLNFWVIFCMCILGSLTWFNWTGKEEACAAIVPEACIVYVFSKQCAYLFLYDRAKIVHEAFRFKNKKLKYLRWLIWLTIVAGIPAGFFWHYWYVWSGRVLPEGNCVWYSVQYEAVVLVFAVADVGLNVSMLLLFAIPLNRHLRNMAMMGNDSQYPNSEPSKDSNSSQTNLRQVMIRNVQVSVLVTSCTVIGLSVLIGICLQYRGANIPPEQDYIQMWAIFSPNVDMFLTSLILHSVTSVWLPSNLRDMLSSHVFSAKKVDKASRVKSAAVTSSVKLVE